MEKRNHTYIYPLLIVPFVLALFGFFYTQSLRLENSCIEQIRHDLEVRTRLVLPFVREKLNAGNVAALRDLNKEFDFSPDTRVTVLDVAGNVIADTVGEPEWMENHSTRPEVRSLQELSGTGERFSFRFRYSATLDRRMFYCSTLLHCDRGVFIIRTSLDSGSVDEVIRESRLTIWAGTIAAILLSLLAAVMVWSFFTRPQARLAEAARHLAGGELDGKLPVPRYGALRELAGSLSAMTEELKKRIFQISREKAERDAMFDALSEGVLLLDENFCIVAANGAARRIFGGMQALAEGQDLVALVGENEFELFLRRSLGSASPGEKEFLFRNLASGSRTLRIRARAMAPSLRSISGSLPATGGGQSKTPSENPGLLLVVYDLTAWKKLENFRQDFVANVSHEIRTPLTAILGAAETLNDGALEDAEAARKFMKIIVKNSSRLTSLVEDVLSLSSLECRPQDDVAEFREFSAMAAAECALEVCQSKAEKRHINLVLEDASAGKTLFADRKLLEQALINLIDNALKYTVENDTVFVRVKALPNGKFRYEVTDHGPGIAPEYQSRLFERFFRVDKSRSREVGGTGLGLAIVKHIMQLHGGSAEVFSVPGAGATFALQFPDNPRINPKSASSEVA